MVYITVVIRQCEYACACIQKCLRRCTCAGVSRINECTAVACETHCKWCFYFCSLVITMGTFILYLLGNTDPPVTMVAELQQTIKDLLSQVEDLRRSGAEKNSHIAQIVSDFALVFGMRWSLMMWSVSTVAASSVKVALSFICSLIVLIDTIDSLAKGSYSNVTCIITSRSASPLNPPHSWPSPFTSAHPHFLPTSLPTAISTLCPTIPDSCPSHPQWGCVQPLPAVPSGHNSHTKS